MVGQALPCSVWKSIDFCCLLLLALFKEVGMRSRLAGTEASSAGQKIAQGCNPSHFLSLSRGLLFYVPILV